MTTNRNSSFRGRYFSNLPIILLSLLIVGTPSIGADNQLITVGIYENAPKVFISESDKPAGIFIDIIEYIAKREGWHLQYVPGTWVEGLDRLEKKEIDLMPDMAYTADRETIFAFHKVPVLSSWFQVYARKGSGIKSILDLGGKRIAVLERSVQEDAFVRLAAGFELNTTLISLPDYQTVFERVARGEVDAAITNRFYGVMHAKKFGLEDTAVIFSPSDLFFAASKKDPKQLLTAIDRHLLDLKKDTQSMYYESLKRWTSEEVRFKFPVWLKALGLVTGAALLISLLGSVVLKYKVNARTRELHKMNRVLRTLSECNQALVRSADEAGLLDAICRVVVDIGGYRLAWVGFAETGTNKTIRPVTQVGFEEGNLATVNINWSHAESVCSLTNNAFQTSQPCSARHILTDPDLEPLRDEALKRGYSSALVLPLLAEGETIGVLGIYSVEPDAFDTEEVAQLTELSGNLAFGIVGHRTHGALKQVEVQRQEALRESEENYRILFENAPDLIIVINTEGNFLDLNKKFEEESGYSREEIIGTSAFTSGILTESSVNMSIPYLEDILAGKKWISLEVEGVTKDGRKIPYELMAVPIKKDGKTVAVQATLRNVTERKQAEESLRESKEKFHSIVDNIGIGVALISPTMEILELNRQMREWFPDIDQSMRPICYRAFNDPPRDKICDYCPTCKTFQDGKLHETSTVRPTADGPRNYHIVSSPIFDANGKVTAAIEMVNDITEGVSLEAQLRQSQKMEAIGTLAGGVAHDFNNILTTIIGYADLMLMNIDTDKPLTEEIKEIKIAGERAAALTRQLLAFSRKQIVQPKILDLNKLLKGIDKMLVRLIGEDIEILMIPESALWKVEIDPGQMEQVIMNLVVNAKDAMPIGGKLTIETVNIDLDENYFNDHGIVEKRPGPYVMMAVSDTGSGMDKEVQEHIFDPFYTTKEKGKGTGLGLSTIYGIVKQNNGFIWVYSEPGQGSTFKVYLPKVKRDVKEDEKEQPPVENLSGSETVLIVEDDDSLRKLAQKSLQLHGYRVLAAENGEDALRISKEHEGTIDLMITDVVMPKMGGKETAERLQTLHPQMKVIYMSGYTDDSIVHHGVLAPGLNFLEKPFSPKGLARKVREVLDKQIDD